MTVEEEKLYEDLFKKTGIDLKPLIKLSEQLTGSSDDRSKCFGLLISWICACFVLDIDGPVLAEAAKFFSYYMTTIMHYAEEALVKQEPPAFTPSGSKRFVN
jgi:hypothetical protein